MRGLDPEVQERGRGGIRDAGEGAEHDGWGGGAGPLRVDGRQPEVVALYALEARASDMCQFALVDRSISIALYGNIVEINTQ